MFLKTYKLLLGSVLLISALTRGAAIPEEVSPYTEIPRNATDADVVRAENIGGIFICDGYYWGGECGYAVQPLNTCIDLGSDWNDRIGSIGPDPGTLVDLYIDWGCTGGPDARTVSYPGGNLNYPWNNKVSSFVARAG